MATAGGVYELCSFSAIFVLHFLLFAEFRPGVWALPTRGGYGPGGGWKLQKETWRNQYVRYQGKAAQSLFVTSANSCLYCMRGWLKACRVQESCLRTKEKRVGWIFNSSSVTELSKHFVSQTLWGPTSLFFLENRGTRAFISGKQGKKSLKWREHRNKGSFGEQGRRDFGLGEQEQSYLFKGNRYLPLGSPCLWEALTPKV